MYLSPETRQAILAAAHETIRRRLSGDSSPLTFPPHAELSQPAGCFVSLHRRGTHALRGCIGTIDAEKPLSQSLASAAGSVLEDPRFRNDPVTLEELPDLEIEVTVLGPLQPTQNPLDFDPLNEGIYLTIGDRAGCFLPQVARETGWSKEQLLARLCTEKMGLDALAWQDPSAKLQVFPAIVILPS
jgi:AmmeMemoRadiSam system protein A